MVLDCANLYECVHLHGGGPDDLQLHLIRQNYGDQGLAIWVIFCTIGNPVGVSHAVEKIRSSKLIVQ